MVSLLELIRQQRTAQLARENTRTQLTQAREATKDVVNKPAKGFFDSLLKPSDILIKKQGTPQQKQQMKDTAVKQQFAPATVQKRQVTPSTKPRQTLQLPKITQLPVIQKNKGFAKFLKDLGF